jgi:hypothetical protein
MLMARGFSNETIRLVDHPVNRHVFYPQGKVVFDLPEQKPESSEDVIAEIDFAGNMTLSLRARLREAISREINAAYTKGYSR